MGQGNQRWSNMFFLTEVIDLVCVTYHDLTATSLELIGFGELSQYLPSGNLQDKMSVMKTTFMVILKYENILDFITYFLGGVYTYIYILNVKHYVIFYCGYL